MRPIHQIYCTHCTYGSSALERRTGGERDRVLGYSARASSFDLPTLRKYYAAVERFLYYDLPSDTPTDKKASRTSRNSPRRLFFVPNVSNLQVAGQICHRPTDRAGRPGSYFAHLLVTDLAEGPPDWNVLDCLQWWAAPGWVDKEPDGGGWSLPQLDKQQMLGGKTPAVDDQVLRKFLFDGGNPNEAQSAHPELIPGRWQTQPAERRRQVLHDLLLGYLDVLRNPTHCLLLAEPGVAALLFYGVARLLPDSGRGQLSFSTYESGCDRLGGGLTAMTFDDVTRAVDVPLDRYQRGFVYNTFSHPERKSAWQQEPCTTYVQDTLTALDATLSGRDPRALEEVLSDYEVVRVQDPDQLEQQARRRALLQGVLDQLLTGQEISADAWTAVTKDLVWKNWLCRGWETRLAKLAHDPTHTVRTMLQSPLNVMRLAQLFSSLPAPPQACQQTLDDLFDNFPSERLAELAKFQDVVDAYYVRAFCPYLRKHQKLPADCPGFWRKRYASAVIKNLSDDKSGVDLIRRLWSQVLVENPRTPGGAVLATKGRPERTSFLEKLLSNDQQDAVAAILAVEGDRDVACLVVQRIHPARLKPGLRGLLAQQLKEALFDLPLSPNIPERLAALRLAQDSQLLEAPGGMLEAWSEIEQALRSELPAQAPKSGWLRGAKGSDHRELVRCISQQLTRIPANGHRGFANCSERVKILCCLAQHCGRQDLLSGEFETALRNGLEAWRPRSLAIHPAVSAPSGAVPAPRPLASPTVKSASAPTSPLRGVGPAETRRPGSGTGPPSWAVPQRKAPSQVSNGEPHQPPSGWLHLLLIAVLSIAILGVALYVAARLSDP